MSATGNANPLHFEPPGPGSWELDPVHFPRPVTRYLTETHPEAFRRGVRDFTSFYGMLIDGLEYRFVNGFVYKTVHPVAPDQIPQRFQRAEEVFEKKLWREQLHEWDQKAKPASIKAHRELQAIDPDKLSDEDLIAYLARCRNHHSQMISQHMRYTAGAVVPTGDFLAHVGDWTGLPPAQLLGLMRGAAPVSAGASAELERLIAAMGKDAHARELLASKDDPGRVLQALRSLDSEAGAAMAGYLDLVGYRLLDGFDISEPYALELPDVLLRAIRIAVEVKVHEDKDLGQRIADVRAKVPEFASGGVRRVTRRGAAPLSPARRARCLQRHLGLRPDAPRRARGRAPSAREGAAPRRQAFRRRQFRGNVGAAARRQRALGGRAGSARRLSRHASRQGRADPARPAASAAA